MRKLLLGLLLSAFAPWALAQTNFTPDAGYTASGTFTDGQTVTINRAAGGFGTKPKGAKPWLYIPDATDLLVDLAASRGTSANITADSNGNSYTSAEHPPNSAGSRRILMNDQNNTVGFSFTSPTMEVYVFAHRKFGWDTLHDGIATNHKMMRCRANDHSGVPNTYLGHSSNPELSVNSDMDTGGVYHVTGLGAEFMTGFSTTVFPDSITTQWHTMEGVFRSSTAPNAANAQIIGWINGARVFYYPETVIPGVRDTAGFITNDRSDFPGWGYVYMSQISNNLEPANYFYYGPLLVEDSLARLIVSDEATWTTTMATAHVRDFQLPTAWADGSITLKIRQGIHATLAGKYLWVVKSDGFTAMRAGQFSGGGPPDTTAPSVPTGLTATAISSSQINLAWTASTDNVGVTGYQIDRCQGVSCSTFSLLTTQAGVTLNNTGLNASTSYSYRVRATDAASNLSGNSSTASATTSASPDTTPPSAPTGVTGSGPNPTTVSWSWAACSDPSGIRGYVPSVSTTLNGTYTDAAEQGALSYSTSSGITSGTSRYARVRCIDNAGNASANTTLGVIATSQVDSTAPAAPTGLTGGVTGSPTTVSWSWAACNDPSGIRGYQPQIASAVGGPFVDQPEQGGTTFSTSSGITSNTSRWLKVRCVDNATNPSAYTAAVQSTSATTVPGIPQNLLIDLKVNADNTVDTRYPLGDKTPSAQLACDLTGFPSLVNLPTGTAFSSNIRSKFTGTAAAAAALSIVPVSGSDPATSGWSISGNNLANPASIIGSGAFRVRGTVVPGGNSADCAASNWSIVGPIGSDTLSPTIPTGFQCVGGTGVVNCTNYASVDPYTGGAPGSGVTKYDLRLGSTIVQTLTGQAHGLSQPFTQNIIGTSDGTPSSTQNGANWTLSFGGSGMLAATDNLLMQSTSVTGDTTAIVKVVSLTTAGTNPSVGLMARESNAPNAAMIACRYQPDGTVSIRRRAVTGGSAVNIANDAVPALPVWLKFAHVGDVWGCDFSGDGSNFASGTTVTQPMAPTVLEGEFLTSGTAGINATAQLDQLNLNNVPPITFSHTTTVGGDYSARAGDVALNNSSYSNISTATPSGPTDAAPPIYSAQPSGNGISATQIAWNLGTCTDPSGVSTYTPSLSTTLNGTYVDQTPQASNLYTQSGLSASTTRYLKSKCTDTLGNTTALTPTVGVSATTTGGGGGATLLYSYSFAPFVSPFPTGNPWGSVGDTGCTESIDTSFSRDAPGTGGSFKSNMSSAFPDNSHCMIVYRGPQPDFLIGSGTWMGFSIYLASPWVSDYFLINMQLHPHNSGTTNNPMFKLDSQAGAGGRWLVQILGDSTNEKPYDRSNTYTLNAPCGTIKTNAWTDFVMHFRLGGGSVVRNPPGTGSSTYQGNANGGFYELWVDGVQCLTQAQTAGLNYYVNDPPGPSLSLGTYHGSQGAQGSPQRHMYVDEIRIGYDSDGVGYADVVPR